jgi:hypothetical protein
VCIVCVFAVNRPPVVVVDAEPENGESHSESKSVVTCSFCNKTCKTHAGLESHKLHKHHTQQQQFNTMIQSLKRKTRYRPNWGRKRSIIQICLDNPGVSHANIGRLNNTTSSQISKWIKQCFDPACWRPKRGACNLSACEKRGAFKEAEAELWCRFLYRRVHYGLYVDGIWLRAEMKTILAVFKPRGYLSFKASKGWLWRWCTRWGVSSQAKTDSKSESAEVRKVKILAVIDRYFRIQHSGPLNDAMFGRFAADQHWHTDSVPVSFSHPRRRSLNAINTPCWINAIVESCWAKRQATIHLTIRAAGTQVVPPVLIVKGSGRDVSDTEMAHWLGLEHVVVYYQPKAWCDRHFQKWFLLNVFDKYIKESGDLREQLLCLDNHAPHKTPEILELMEELNITPHWLAPLCTDVAAPVDHHVGALLKVFIRNEYESSLEDPYNFVLWREQDDPETSHLSASRRRMLMGTWLDTAWGFLRTKSDFFLSSFLSTGCLICLDGSHRIKMRGIPGMN